MDDEPRDPHFRSESAITVRDMVLRHDTRLDSLEDWRSEIRGAFGLIKLAFGTSIMSGTVSLLALIGLLSQR